MKEFKQTNRTEGSFSKGAGSICVVWRWVAGKKGNLWSVKSRYYPVTKQGGRGTRKGGSKLQVKQRNEE